MNTAATEQPREQVVYAVGTSMFPLIRGGAQAGLRPVAEADLRVGDIIAFRAGDRIVMHRMIETRRKDGHLWLHEKGDHRLAGSWIDSGELIGRVAWVKQDGALRDMESARDSRRIRFLSACSRWQARLCEPLSRVYRWIRGWSPFVARMAALLLHLLFLPFGLLLAPLLLAAYRVTWPAPRTEERTFLLGLLRRVAGSDAALDEQPASGLDWTTVLTLAIWHGLTPQIDDILTAKAETLSPPTSMLDQLRRSRHRSLFGQLSATQTLHDIDRALGGERIPYAVLKGPYLAHTLYADSMRAFSDVDILVPRDTVAAVARALSDAYRVASGTAPGGGPRMIGHFHCTLTPVKHGRCTIEPHWSLVDRANLYRIPDREVLSRLRRVAIGDQEISVLSLEDDFLYLCLHIAKHAFFNPLALRAGAPPEWYVSLTTGNRLLWFLDLHKFLSAHGEALQWLVVRERAAAWNALDDVACSLRVLNLLIPSPAAARAMTECGRPGTQTPRRKPLSVRFLFDTRPGAALLGHAMRMSGTFFFRPARLFMLGGLLFPPPRRLAQYHRAKNRWVIALLYLIHPFHMIRKIVWG